MNKVVLLGRLTKDIEVRYTESGTAVGNLTLAVKRRIKNTNGEYESDFISDYYREFIEDYNVEVVDYIMNKNITPNAMTASIMNLIYKKNIKAEKMIGEFFDVELDDSLGNIMTNERNGIVTTMHVYTDMFDKDSVRFNGLQIWTDEKDGHVRRVEFTLDNSGIISVPIEDTP